MGSGKGIESTSESLQEKVKAMNKPIRELLYHENPDTRHASYRSICESCKELSRCIEAFEKSLYVQKHAYYFRRVREWHDYNEVRYCVRSGNSWPNRILQIAYKKLGEIHLLY